MVVGEAVSCGKAYSCKSILCEHISVCFKK